MLQRDRVVAAIATLARQLDLPPSIHILSERGNIIAQLGDSDIIARAIYLNAFICPDTVAAMAREITTAVELGRAGASAMMPVGNAPYVVDDIPITLWQNISPGDETRSPRVIASSLKSFHDAAARLALPAPWLAPLTELVPNALDALAAANALDQDVLSRLWRDYQRLLDILPDGTSSSTTVIHGDAHAGNLILGPKGYTWIDLEDVCPGPLEWDLACLLRTQRLDGRAAVSAYLDIKGRSLELVDGLTPYLEARELQAAVWILALAHQRPDRYRRLSDEWVASLLARI